MILKRRFVSIICSFALLMIAVLSYGVDVQAASKPSYEEKLISFNYYKNSIGSVEYYGIVEITNTGKTDLYLADCTFDLEDNNGHLLQSDSFVSSCRNVIGPGEKGYFYNGLGGNLMDDGVDISNGVKLVPDCTVKEAKGRPHTYQVVDTDFKKGSYGYPTITGRVVNDTNEDVSYMYINFIFYDKSGKILGITGTSVTDIKAGKKGSFDCSLMYCDDAVTFENVAKYEIVAEDSYYQW